MNLSEKKDFMPIFGIYKKAFQGGNYKNSLK